MCRRDIEPRRGILDLAGRFSGKRRDPADGAQRETLEETGSRVADLTPYLMVDIVHISQIYLMFAHAWWRRIFTRLARARR